MGQTAPDEPPRQSLSTTSRRGVPQTQDLEARDSIRYLRAVSRTQSRARHRRWFGVFIALLPFCATVYFIWYVATPMFSSDTRFAIRGGQAQSLSFSSFAGKGSSSTDALGAFVDGYAVRDFLQSREALKQISAKVDFPSMAVRPQADPLVRLPANATEDMLFQAFGSMVKVNYNIFEQILALRCFGFTPEDSVKLCRTVVQVSEAFADQMNRRAREDVLRVASTEVDLAQQSALEARTAVNAWREQNANVDPTSDASMIGGLINSLESQRLAAESDLSQIKASSPNSPRRASVERQLQTLRDQIKAQRARIGGADTADNTAKQIKGYETLKAAQDFADSNLSTLRQSLEQARIDMIRQQRFVAVIAQPLISNTPSYPEKTTPLIASLIGGIAFAFFGSVIIGMVRGILFA